MAYKLYVHVLMIGIDNVHNKVAYGYYELHIKKLKNFGT